MQSRAQEAYLWELGSLKETETDHEAAEPASQPFSADCGALGVVLGLDMDLDREFLFVV